MLAPLVAIVTFVSSRIEETFAGLIDPLVRFGQRIAEVFGQAADGVIAGLGRLRYLIAVLLSIDFIWQFVQTLLNAFSTAAAAVGSMIEATVAEIMSLVAPIIQLGRDLVGTFLAFLNSLRTSFVSMVGGIATAIGSLAPVARGVWASLSAGMADTVSHARAAFSTILATGMQAFDGIWYAFNAGNWELMWEVFKATALLMFHDLTAFVQDTWIVWKNAGATIFVQIGDGLYNALADSWTAVRVFLSQALTSLALMFDGAYESIESGFFRLGIAIIDAWTRADGFIMRSLRNMIGMLGPLAGQLGLAAIDSVANLGRAELEELRRASASDGAERRRMIQEGGAGEVATIRAQRESQAMADWFEAAIRDVDADTRADLERQLASDINDELRSVLQGRLDHMNADAMEAFIVAEQRRLQGDGLPVFDAGAVGFGVGGSGKAIGGFGAAQIFGRILESRNETPQARLERLQVRQAELLEDSLRMLERIERVAGARVS